MVWENDKVQLSLFCIWWYSLSFVISFETNGTVTQSNKANWTYIFIDSFFLTVT